MINTKTTVKSKKAKVAGQTMADLVDKYTEDIPIIKEGETVKAKIMEIRDNQVLLDVSGMTTGIISGKELNDGLGTVDDLEVGDEISAMVIDAEDESGQILFSLRRAGQEKLWEILNERMKKKESFAAEVTEANKGGIMIDVGGVRGFLPVSQLIPEHYPRVEGGNKEEILTLLRDFIGQKLDVVIIGVDPQEKKLILSEKEAIAGEHEEKLNDLKKGDVVTGKVSGVVDFGFFVQFNGLEGLVHISEISWDKVEHPSDYVKSGDDIEVSILSIEKDRISLSMKRLKEDPWVKTAKKYKVGQVVEGTVTKITPFGAFAKLDDKIDGLIHISELSDDKVTDPGDFLKTGEKMKFKIISLEPGEHRLGLSIKALKQTTSDKSEIKSKKKKAEKENKDKDGDGGKKVPSGTRNQQKKKAVKKKTVKKKSVKK